MELSHDMHLILVGMTLIILTQSVASRSNDNCSMESPKSRRRTNSKPDKKRPSFSNASSPWIRRNSFLSPAMIDSENISIYESPNYYHECSSYNIISLKECQGYIFNQDLFASPYQQLKSLANERLYRASFSHGKSRSSSTTSSNSKPNCGPFRRHTSVTLNMPNFHPSILQGNAIDDDDDAHDIVPPPHHQGPKIMEDGANQTIDQFENTTVDITVSDDDFEEYDEVNDSYKVRVTEIIVNDTDDIFPN